MQTFLPSDNMLECARVLDYKRLGKQRLEAVECLSICLDEPLLWISAKQFEYLKRRYANGVLVRMWKGYEEFLKYYLHSIISEWINRGYRNSIELPMFSPSKGWAPPWLGDDRLHSSHRAALLFKNFEYYSQFGWKEKPKWEYYWPM